MRVELPLAAFGAALLVLFTSPLFWRTRNIPLLSAAAWLFIVNVVYGVNALVWSDHARDVATIYCDIGAMI
jgi:pheromone a factor receptor